MAKIEKIFLENPVISQQIATKMLWNLYALNYNSKDMLGHFSKSIVKNHQNLSENEIVNCVKTFGHFKFLDDSRDALVKMTIKKSQFFTFKSLGEICENLGNFGPESGTLLKIVQS
jgi:hypothetical protein